MRTTPGAHAHQTNTREISLWHLLNYLFTYRLLIAVATVALPALVSCWFVISKSTYRTSVYVNIDFSHADKDLKSRPLGALGDDQQVTNKINLVEQYFDSMDLKSLALKVINTPTDRMLSSLERASIVSALSAHKFTTNNERAKWLFAKMDLKPTSDHNRLEVTSIAETPQLAAALANLGSRCLLKLNHHVLIGEILTLKSFLEVQTTQTKHELVDLEGQLADLQRRAKIVSPEDMRSKVNTIQADERLKLADLTRQAAAASIMISETEGDIKNLKRSLQEGVGVSQLYVDQVQRRLEVLRYQRAQAIDQRSPASAQAPADGDASSLDREIANVRKDLDTQLNSDRPLTSSPWDYIKKLEATLFELRQRRTSVSGELKAYTASIHGDTADFSSLPQQLRDLTEIKRSIELTSNLYTALRTREQETNIREAAHVNDLVVISPAVIPKNRSGTGLSRSIGLAALGGFGLAILILFLRYIAVPLIRDSQDLSAMGFKNLGSLPKIRRPHEKFSFNPRGYKLLRVEDTEGHFMYSLDLIRLRLQQALQELTLKSAGKGRVVTLSSAGLGEGRTFFAVNLADIWASKNKRVCLLDLNFEQLQTRNYFKLEQPVMNLEKRFEDFTICSTTVNMNLDLLEGVALKSGQRPESYESEAFTDFFAQLRERYDLIIIDAPEIQVHAESVILLQKSDAIITVVNQRTTLASDLQGCLDFMKSMTSAEMFSILNCTFDELRDRTRKIA